MKKQVLAALILCLFAGALSAGFSLGRPAAVKKRVSTLDEKVRAKLAASGPAAPAANHAPTASVTAVSTTVAAGGLALLSVSAADADGDALSYVWSSTAGALGGAGTSVNWLAPSTPGVYAVTCVVSDGEDTAPGTLLVTAVSPGTPKFIFTPAGSPNFNVAPAVSSGGIVYAAGDDAKLYAINPDGTQKWAFSTDTLDLFSALPPVVGGDGTIYILAAGTDLYAINPDGTKKWPAPFVAPNAPSNAPVVGKDGTVYVLDDGAGPPNVLYAVDGTGVGVATFTALSVAYPCAPVIGKDGTIYLLDGNDMLRAVSPEGLAKSTDTDLTGISGVPPAVAGDGSFYWVDSNTALYARHSDGTAYWGPYPAVPAGNIIDAPVIGSDGELYLYDDTPALYQVSSTTGAGLPFTALAAVASQVVPGPDGVVYVVDGATPTDLYGVKSDGSFAWGPRSPDLGAVINQSPGVGADGTVAFSADDNSVYAFYSTASLP